MTDGKISGVLKRSGDGLYLGGAAASLAASVPFINKYKDAFLGLPWNEMTGLVKYPWEAIGAGELGQVMKANERDKAEGVATHPLEKAGRFLRPANLAALPIAYATDDNGLYALVATGAATVLGHGLEYIGSA